MPSSSYIKLSTTSNSGSVIPATLPADQVNIASEKSKWCLVDLDPRKQVIAD